MVCMSCYDCQRPYADGVKITGRWRRVLALRISLRRLHEGLTSVRFRHWPAVLSRIRTNQAGCSSAGYVTPRSKPLYMRGISMLVWKLLQYRGSFFLTEYGRPRVLHMPSWVRGCQPARRLPYSCFHRRFWMPVVLSIYRSYRLPTHSYGTDIIPPCPFLRAVRSASFTPYFVWSQILCSISITVRRAVIENRSV